MRHQDEATILVVEGTYKETLVGLGVVRSYLGEILGLTSNNSFCPVWVVDFPLYEWSETENRYVSAHNPFTMPGEENFYENYEKSKARSFDLVINGYEIASGAQRIDDPEMQKKMFESLKIRKKDIRENFEWFTQAYKYGAPYHSGMGLGIDRLAMILNGTSSIRDVIAFPKNKKGYETMMMAPAPVKDNQLKDLHLRKTTPKNIS